MGSVQEIDGIFYPLHQMFTLNSLLLICDVILQQDFVQKWSWLWDGSTYFAKRSTCSTFYTQKYTQSFSKAFRCWLGWDIENLS